MREHGARADQAEAVVCREVIRRPRKGAQHVRDLLRVLVQVGLKADVRIVAHQRLADLEHGFRRREGEARSHGVAQAIVPVKALDQRPALLVGALRGVAQRLRQQAVGKHQPAHDADSLGGGGLEQHRRGVVEMRAEDQRRGGSVTRQRVHKLAGDGAGVVRFPHADFLGQRVAVQPVEQPAAESADDAQLGEMNVRIDEPGQHDTAAQVVYRDLGMGRAHGRIVAGRLNYAAAQKQCPIGEALQRIGFPKGIARRMQNGRANNLRPGVLAHESIAPTSAAALRLPRRRVPAESRKRPARECRENPSRRCPGQTTRSRRGSPPAPRVPASTEARPPPCCRTPRPARRRASESPRGIPAASQTRMAACKWTRHWWRGALPRPTPVPPE